jgi:PAS domain-containing protein
VDHRSILSLVWRERHLERFAPLGYRIHGRVDDVRRPCWRDMLYRSWVHGRCLVPHHHDSPRHFILSRLRRKECSPAEVRHSAAGLFLRPNDSWIAGIRKINYPEIAAFIGLYIVTNVSVVFSLNRNLLALAAANKEAKNLAGALQKHNIVLDTAINSMTFGLAMFDAEGRLEVCNTQFKENSCLPTSMIVKGVKFDYLVDLDNDGLLSREASNSLRDLFGSSLERKDHG